MINYFKETIDRHRALWHTKGFATTTIIGLLFFGVSLIINQYAGAYALIHGSNWVSDIILDNIPTLEVDFIFSEGSVFLIIFTILLLIHTPRHIPFVSKTLALFIVIRSAFITLTHLGPFPDRLIIDPTDFISRFTFGADLFFSGHTGLPFLLALIFWKNKKLRILYCFSSVLFGASALLGHLHYSIDVFAAFFITYSIYNIAIQLFQKDFALMKQV